MENGNNNAVSEKDFATTFLMAWFLGTFGADRFYVGKIGSGVAKLITIGGLGIWVLIDLIMLGLGNYTDAKGNRILSKAASPDQASSKDFGTTFLFAGFLGLFGADRFYLGKTGTGVAKLLTGGGCGIWAIVDYIMLGLGKCTDSSGKIVCHR
jgi:TM2 domain-containing membrane protein YozV